MNIVILNYPYLQKGFQKLGNQVFSLGKYPECNRQIDHYEYDDISSLVPFEPDVYIYADALDQHILFPCISKITKPLIYIAIDTPINLFWQKHYSKCFDYVFLDQIETYQQVRKAHQGAFPLLLSFDPQIFKNYNLQKQYDITFVGRSNPNTRIKRHNLLKKITENKLHINIIDGQNQRLSPQELAHIYNASKIVINENLFPSINQRFIEALACHTVCFSEDYPQFIKKYFEDGKHFVSYNHTNMIEKLKYFLAKPDKCLEISQNGYQFVQSCFTEKHQALHILQIINEFPHKQKRDPLSLFGTSFRINSKWKQTPLIKTQISISQTKNLSDRFNYLLYSFYHKQTQEIQEVWQQGNLNPYEVTFFLAYFLIKSEYCKEIKFIYDNYFKSYEPSHAKGWHYTHVYQLGLYLQQQDILIDLGFTSSTKSPFLYTAFDCFLFCMQNGYKKEKSILKMIDILTPLKAFEQIFQLYTILVEDMHINKYKKQLQYYQKIIYL